jgi:CBS-domain-containing membrane protein
MLKISDIMSRDVFTVSAAVPIEDVAWALAIRGISGAPVRDGKGRLVGTLTKAELIDPDRGAWHTSPPVARDVMSPRVTVIRADEPAMAAVRLMSGQGIPHLIVVDRDEAVVGIVTPMDVLKALVHGDSFVEEARPELRRPEASPGASWEAEATAC